MQVKAIPPLPSFAIGEKRDSKGDSKRNKKDANSSKRPATPESKETKIEAVSENSSGEIQNPTSSGQFVDSESMVELLQHPVKQDTVRESQKARQKYTAIAKQKNPPKT